MNIYIAHEGKIDFRIIENFIKMLDPELEPLSFNMSTGSQRGLGYQRQGRKYGSGRGAVARYVKDKAVKLNLFPDAASLDDIYIAVVDYKNKNDKDTYKEIRKSINSNQTLKESCILGRAIKEIEAWLVAMWHKTEKVNGYGGLESKGDIKTIFDERCDGDIYQVCDNFFKYADKSEVDELARILPSGLKPFWDELKTAFS